MGINLGNTTIGSLYLGSTKIAEAYIGSVKVYGASAPAPTLPAYTMRLEYNEGVTPTFSKGTGTQVSSSPNVWDLTYENADWGGMFYGTGTLKGVLGANLSNVTSIRYMFASCSNLVSAEDIYAPDATNMEGVFESDRKLEIAKFTANSSATNMSAMFRGCYMITTSNISLTSTSSVTDFGSAFLNCPLITGVPSGIDTSSATSTAQMFSGCTALASVPLLDTSKVKSMNDMFNSCSSLTTLPLLDTGNVTNMQNMCTSCTSLTAIPLFNTTKVTNVRTAFGGCVNVASGALALYTQMSTQAAPPTTTAYCFDNCGSNTTTGAAELAQIPSSWGGTGA